VSVCRLLLANNQAVFSLSDVFLAKAAADDQFSAIEYEESVLERDEPDDGGEEDGVMGDEESRIEGTDLDANSEYGDVGFGTAPPSMDDLRGEAFRQDAEQQARRASLAAPSLSSGIQQPHLRQHLTSPTRDRITSFGASSSAFGPPPPSLARFGRRPSASSIRPFSIYSNTGLAAETIASSAGVAGVAGGGGGNQLASAVTAAQTGASAGRADESQFAPMQAIPEGQRAPSVIEHGEADLLLEEGGEKETAQSLIWQLPLGIISLYFLLGLHGGACDQVFGTFVVTKVRCFPSFCPFPSFLTRFIF
jgi:hypothetical protein